MLTSGTLSAAKETAVLSVFSVLLVSSAASGSLVGSASASGALAVSVLEASALESFAESETSDEMPVLSSESALLSAFTCVLHNMF